MKVEGLKEVQEKLKALERKERAKVTKKALRAGAKVVQQEAKSNAPVASGTLKKNIKVRTGKSRKGAFSIIVGIGKKWFTGPVFYAAFVIFGHYVGSRKLGSKRTKVEPNTFMKDAYDRQKEQALGQIETTYKELLDDGD